MEKFIKGDERAKEKSYQAFFQVHSACFIGNLSPHNYHDEFAVCLETLG